MFLPGLKHSLRRAQTTNICTASQLTPKTGFVILIFYSVMKVRKGTRQQYNPGVGYSL
jgi:hypothetical protein